MAAEGSVPRQIDIGGSVGIGNAGGAVPRLIGHVRVAGMIAGAVMVFLWKYCIADLAPVLKIYELLPAFIVASVVIIVVSLITPEPEKEIVEIFDEVNAQ